MRERVYLRFGKLPVILVAPHGADDTHTATIAKEAAERINAYAVVNQGFERAPNVDVDNDKANCNRIDHLNEDVVYEEFLKPLLTFKDRIENKFFTGAIAGQLNQWNNYAWAANTDKRVLVFNVHGAGNIVHQEANEPVEVIVGYGLGNKKDSITMVEWRKNLFIDTYRRVADDGEVFEASGGSKYAGRSANNLNQYFRKHQNDRYVESLQLEFPYSTRSTKKAAVITAAKLAVVIEQVAKSASYKATPHPKFI